MSTTQTHQILKREIYNAEVQRIKAEREAALKSDASIVYIAPRVNGYWIRGLNRMPLWLKVDKRY